MAATTLSDPATMTDRDLRAIVSLVYAKSGITLHQGKRELVRARLQRRLRQLGLSTYREYVGRLRQDDSGEELTILLDAIATNHTSFFREPQHFEFLRDQVVPALRDKTRGVGIDGWCAGSSTGEEAVTIAITLLEAGIDGFKLLASDLSTKALRAARRATYTLERVQGVPGPLLRKYFQRGLGEHSGLARVAPAVRRLIDYRALNLVATDRQARVFDFIFCRNVMIYFDTAVQQRVVSMLERRLAPGGYLFISHSESLNGITHSMQWIAPAVYRRSVQ